MNYILIKKVVSEKLVPMFCKKPDSVVDKKALRKWETLGPFGSEEGGI